MGVLVFVWKIIPLLRFMGELTKYKNTSSFMLLNAIIGLTNDKLYVRFLGKTSYGIESSDL